MKITCNACGAKYSIADEKVLGKRVKVRCKSCKANILVDGTGGAGGAAGDADGAEESEEALDLGKGPQLSLGPVLPGTGLGAESSGVTIQEAPVPIDAGKPPERKTQKRNAWSVNLTDDDSREMTTDEIVQGWKDGIVTQDAYVWKDGMPDWKPILEVPELKLRLKNLPAKGAAAPVATSAGHFAAPAGAAPAASPAKPGGAASPPAASALDADDDKKPTGARNESSVLFSLDALKAPAAPAPKPAAASADDIFGGLSGGGLGAGLGGGLLGAGTDLLTAPAKDPAPVAQVRPVAAATAVEAPAAKSKIPMILGAVAVVAILGGVFVMMQGGDDKAREAAQLAQKEAEAKAQEADEKIKAAEAKAAEAEAKAKEAASKAAADVKAAQDAAAKPAEEKKPDPAAPAAAPAGGDKPAAPAGEKPAAEKPAAAAGAFDTGAAKAALGAAAAGAASCAKPGGPTGSGKVEVTFAPSGRVTTANVISGPFPGTPVGGCVASTFRKARVPAFSGAPVTVAKGFSIQ